jgi:hypothetical protein
MARACFHFVKLFIEKGRTRIKVEVNHVFRGTLLSVEPRSLAPEAQDIFFTDIELPVLHPDELLQIRNELFAELPASLSGDHHRFLTGLVEGHPDCSLMSCEHLAAMPAIRWKSANPEDAHPKSLILRSLCCLLFQIRPLPTRRTKMPGEKFR